MFLSFPTCKTQQKQLCLIHSLGLYGSFFFPPKMTVNNKTGPWPKNSKKNKFLTSKLAQRLKKNIRDFYEIKLHTCILTSWNKTISFHNQ